MLANDDRERIRAEEIYRDEVRRDLEGKRPASSKKKTIWDVLNSSFVLWFLSSVVVAGITAFYAQYTESREEEAKTVETRQHLDIEISNRISQALLGLHITRLRVEKGEVIDLKVIYGLAVQYLSNTFSESIQDVSVYPDLRTRRFRSLILELHSIVPDESEKDELEKALDIYERLADLASWNEDPQMPLARADSLRMSSAAVDDVTSILNDSLLIKRWHFEIFDYKPARASIQKRSVGN